MGTLSYPSSHFVHVPDDFCFYDCFFSDVNECELNLDTCPKVVSHCVNNNGSYSCMCNEGYEMNSSQMCVGKRQL